MSAPTMSGSGTSGSGQPTLGRYILIREIARSNDIVWEGHDPKMNRRVAVKELSLPQHLVGQARRDRIERFYREARAAGTMNHPNIVTIHEVGEDRGRFFIAMEYLEGQTLRDRLSVGGPMGLSEAVAITSALCDALQYAHERGVVHRDIKPDNVHLLPGGRVKLTDFGIARIQHEDQLTVAGQVFGTPSYMSPEQVLGRPIDARTDVFSLGVMLYEMVSGRKPFTGDSVATITYRIVNETTPPMTSGSPALESVIQRATAKDAAARFSSTAEMREALETAEADHRTGGYRASSLAGPPPSAYPLPGATAQYGTRTQMGVAPGFAPGAQMPSPAYTPPIPVYASEPYPVRGGGGGRIAAIIGTILTVALCFALLALGIMKAMRTAGIEQRQNIEQRHLVEAEEFYKSNMFEKASEEALAIRTTTQNDEIKAEATKTEVYSYLALGEAARDQKDYANAQKWYDLAQQLLPDDPNVKDHVSKFEQAKRYLAADSSMPQSSGSAGSMTGSTPGPIPAKLPTVTPIPAPHMDANQFNQTNQNNAQNAQQLYDEGLQLQQRGDINGARAKWQTAVTVGPGSQAANAANEQLTKTAPSF